MKRIKKILASLMVVVMLLGVAPLADLVGLDFGIKAEAASYKTGDIICFGSYPQSKVKDATLRARLGEIPPNSNNDVFFEGVWYRRLVSSNTTDFYRYDPIEWRVLSNGYDGLYVMAERTLDCQKYNSDTNKTTTWADCFLRGWLNTTFYDTAFSTTEKAKIRLSTLINDDNPKYGTEGGIDTKDRVFVPSYYDVTNTQYGFTSYESRKAVATDFTKALHPESIGLLSATDIVSSWWVRNPGKNGAYACIVDFMGNKPDDEVLTVSGSGKVMAAVGVRPAIKLDPNASEYKSKESSNYQIKAVDGTTGKSISGATVVFDGQTVGTTGADGTYTLSVGVGSVSTKEIRLVKSGYSTSSRKLYELNPYYLNKIALDSGFDISGMLSDIAIVGEVIEGPTVTVMGESFPLFSFNASLNLGKFSFKYQQDTKNKTVKYIVGIKDGFEINNQDDFNDNYKEFKDFFKGCSDDTQYNNYWRYNRIKDKLDKQNGAIGFSVDLSVAGYLEFDYSTGDLVFKEGGIVAIAGAKVSHDVPLGTIGYMTFEIGGELEGKLFVNQNASGFLQLNASLSFAVKPQVGVGIKLISKKVASVEVGLNGSIKSEVKLPATSFAAAFEATLSAQAYLKVRALWIFENSWSTNFPALELYPNRGQFQTSSTGETVLIDEDGNIVAIEEDDLELIDRSYLNDITFGTSSLTPGDLNDESVYPYGYPQLVELDDGRVVALFVYDDGTKSDINRTTLYYSVYDNGSWSKALPVCNSGLADFPVEVCTDGEKVYAVWLRASEVFDDNYSTADIVNKTEIVYAEFNGTEWTTPVTIDTADKYQMMYSIAEHNGEIAVVWAENSLNSYTLEEGTTSVFCKTLTGGEWSGETYICEENGITGLEVGYPQGDLSVLYTVDSDADITTTGDSELYLNGMQITSNDVDEGELSYQNGAFWWIQDGELYTYSCQSGLCVPTGLKVENDYRILTNGSTTAVTYLSTDGFTNEIMVSYLVNGEYTTPVQLTDYGKHISYYDAILNDDGTISLLADVENLSGDVDAYPYTTTDMVCDIISGVTNLGVSDVSYDGVVSRNGEVNFTGKVTNYGTTTVENYNLNFKDASGRVIRSENVFSSILPGETADFSVSYLLSDDFVKQDITVEVVAEGDAVSDDNTDEFTIGYADVEFINATISEDGVLTATVVDNGCDTAKNVKVSVTSLADEDTLLTTLNVGTVGIGETKEIIYQIPDGYLKFASAYVVNKFKLEVTTDTEEERIGNNDIDAIYAPIAVESISLNTSTLSLEYGQTSQLVATVYPSDAYNKKVHWISDSIDVATVDENGNITTVGTGTAIITAIADDGGIVAQCEVKVGIAVTAVNISQQTASMNKGTTLTLVADITPDSATDKNVTWHSSDESIATVSADGVVSALKSGEVIITVKTVNGGYEDSCVITVTTPVTGLLFFSSNVKMYLDETKKLTAKVLPVTADNQTIIWSSSDDYVVSVSDNGLLTAVGVGRATITATTADGEYEKTCTVTVGKHVSNVFLSESVLTVNVGSSKQLTATVMPTNATDKSVEWVSTNSNIATVDENGVVTAVAPGNATIIVSTIDGGFYATCDVFVCSSVSGFSLASNAENIKPNATVQMQPIFEPADAENQNITWTTSDSSIATVDENGLVTGKKMGATVIIATTEDGGYRDYCLIRVLGLLPNDNTNTVVADGYVYGIDSGVDSLESFVTMSDSVCEIEYVNNESGFGTGTLANLVADGKVIDSYTIVIFGDVNGDSWYDGQDAVLVSCLANGMLTKDDVGEAVYMAADCNHDGVIDQADVALLNEAGALLANVDQTKPTEVLLETSSEYVEYLDLIDQSPEIEIEDETDTPEADAETEDTTPEQDAKVNIFEMILNFIKSIFEMLLSYIPMPLK